MVHHTKDKRQRWPRQKPLTPSSSTNLAHIYTLIQQMTILILGEKRKKKLNAADLATYFLKHAATPT